MASDSDNDDNPGFFRQYGAALIVALVVAGAVAGVAVALSGGDKSPPKSRAEMPMVRLALPPLPPPPPPPPPKPEEPKPDTPPTPNDQKMLDQEPVAKAEEKPAEAPTPAPADAPMGTSNQGSGPPDGFGLAYNRTGGGGSIGGGGGNGNGVGGPGGGGSRFGWYAGKVQTQVQSALLANKKTRSAALSLTVRIWADATGRVTRAELSGAGTGDKDLDDAIRTEVLARLTLPEPPPDDMPMPIVMRISGRRP